MTLSEFIYKLLDEGSVTVAGQLVQFEESDRESALVALMEHYKEDALEMPHTAPAFEPGAALWAAEYLYSAIQLTMLRDLGEDKVNEQLKDYSGPMTAEAIYSADLMLRYLPDLLQLAKGLAPGDMLVKRIEETMVKWPFSSAGAELPEEADHSVILENASLRAAYRDRIIKYKDSKRIKNNEQLTELVATALGSYTALLWPGLEVPQKVNDDGNEQ